MNRYAIFVDAGYLLTQTAKVLSGSPKGKRADVYIKDPKGLVAMICAKTAAVFPKKELLRVYWCDGALGTLSPEQRALALLDDVQLRAGIVNGAGVQKGVDSKILTDMIELSQNKAITEALLVTGDGDLAAGIEMAQKHGVRVAVLGIEDTTKHIVHSQSFEITSLADRVIRIGAPDLQAFIQYTPPAAPAAAPAAVPAGAAAAPAAPAAGKGAVPAAPAAAGSAPALPLDAAKRAAIKQAVTAFIAGARPPLTAAACLEGPRIEAKVDGMLMYAVGQSVGNDGKLDFTLAAAVRSEFKAQLRAAKA